jgi:hypothetical protein
LFSIFLFFRRKKEMIMKEEKGVRGIIKNEGHKAYRNID